LTFKVSDTLGIKYLILYVPNDANKKDFIDIFCVGVGGGGGAKIAVEGDRAGQADGRCGFGVGYGGYPRLDEE